MFGCYFKVDDRIVRYSDDIIPMNLSISWRFGYIFGDGGGYAYVTDDVTWGQF